MSREHSFGERFRGRNGVRIVHAVAAVAIMASGLALQEAISAGNETRDLSVQISALENGVGGSVQAKGTTRYVDAGNEAETEEVKAWLRDAARESDETRNLSIFFTTTLAVGAIGLFAGGQVRLRTIHRQEHALPPNAADYVNLDGSLVNTSVTDSDIENEFFQGNQGTVDPTSK